MYLKEHGAHQMEENVADWKDECRKLSQKAFDQAQATLKAFVTSPLAEEQLNLYALFKVATVGDCNICM